MAAETAAVMEILLKIRQEINTQLRETRQEITTFKKEAESASSQFNSMAGAVFTGQMAFLLMRRAVDSVTEAFGEAQNRALQFIQDAERFNTTTDKVQELRYSAIQLNTDFAALENGLRVLDRRIGEALFDSTSKAAQNFRKIGIEVLTANGLVKTAEEVFYELSDKIKSGEIASREMSSAMELLGRGGFANLQLLARGSDEIKAKMQEARDIGVIVSDQDINKINDFRLAWEKVKDVFMSGFMKEFADTMSSLAKTMDTMFVRKQGHVGFFEYLGLVGNALSPAQLSGLFAPMEEEANRIGKRIYEEQQLLNNKAAFEGFLPQDKGNQGRRAASSDDMAGTARKWAELMDAAGLSIAKFERESDVGVGKVTRDFDHLNITVASINKYFNNTIEKLREFGNTPEVIKTINDFEATRQRLILASTSQFGINTNQYGADTITDANAKIKEFNAEMRSGFHGNAEELDSFKAKVDKFFVDLYEKLSERKAQELKIFTQDDVDFFKKMNGEIKDNATSLTSAAQAFGKLRNESDEALKVIATYLPQINRLDDQSLENLIKFVELERERLKLAEQTALTDDARSAAAQKLTQVDRDRARLQEEQNERDPALGFRKGMTDLQFEIGPLGKQMRDFSYNTAVGMRDTFNNLFFANMKGQIHSLKDEFTLLLTFLTDVMARVASMSLANGLMSTLLPAAATAFGGAAAGGGGVSTAPGLVIPKPAGGSSLVANSNAPDVHFHIHAIDPQSGAAFIMQQKTALAAAFVQELQTNHGLRSAIGH